MIGMTNLTARTEFKALAEHQSERARTHLRALFAADTERFSKFSVSLDGLLFDYSKHRITEDTLGLLTDLARACNFEEARARLFAGEKINSTEARAALHPALRTPVDALEMAQEDIDFFRQTRTLLKEKSEDIRKTKTITDVVHIGIGGSDLGPHMVCEALAHLADGPAVHFVSNIDGGHILASLKNLKPENTAFIIASKTFSTLETLANAKAAQDWSAGRSRFLAVTCDKPRALAFGIPDQDILPLKDSIGGRYSLWSCIGLPVAIALGYARFEELLGGAHAADEHFQSAALEENIPVLMALLTVWYRNFFDYRAHAVLPYMQSLHRLPRYLQQIEMESNGKHITKSGETVSYATAPIVFGEPGTNAQHAFLQLLHQGTDIVPCDFIAAINPAHNLQDHHNQLLANALAQSQALMDGQPHAEEAHKHFEGNRPSSTILIDQLDPYHLGMLLALYEHKVFTEGVIWNINSFDQWGVELGKTLAKTLSQQLEGQTPIETTDSSTGGLIKHIQQKRSG